MRCSRISANFWASLTLWALTPFFNSPSSSCLPNYFTLWCYVTNTLTANWKLSTCMLGSTVYDVSGTVQISQDHTTVLIPDIIFPADIHVEYKLIDEKFRTLSTHHVVESRILCSVPCSMMTLSFYTSSMSVSHWFIHVLTMKIAESALSRLKYAEARAAYIAARYQCMDCSPILAGQKKKERTSRDFCDHRSQIWTRFKVASGELIAVKSWDYIDGIS